MLSFARQEVEGTVDAVRPWAMKLSAISFVMFGFVMLVFTFVLEVQMRRDMNMDDGTHLIVLLD